MWRPSRELEKIRRDWEERFREDPTLSSDIGMRFGKPDQHVIDFIEGNKINPYKHKRILDLGCGNGRNSLWLVKNGFEVYGIDFSKSAIDFCKEHVKGAKFIVGYAQQLPFKDEFFDVVIDAGTIHVNPPSERE